MIGLGKMGANMVARLVQGGHEVVGYDLNTENVRSIEREGALGAEDLASLVAALPSPRVVWVMVPAGPATESTIRQLATLLKEGDVIIDGGNSRFTDSVRRAEELSARHLHFVDVGTSGGIWGLAEGYCMMVGGKTEAVELIKPILQTLAPAPDRGWGHVGESGAGHYTKMVHNGIEYGMMQAFAEGFELMRAKHALVTDVSQVAEIWRHGSVIRSWLLDLTADALKGDSELGDLSDFVGDSGEGRWTVEDAMEMGVPIPVISLSVQTRFYTQQEISYAGKVLSAMRRGFGGHAVKRIERPAEEAVVPGVGPLATPEKALNGVKGGAGSEHE
ncbi:6-phosphogluconate dehydrogenase, decarboxylating [Deinococcus peraridilitoris DSM 19664]|uniref:6-phosphogluconate dehydrogenase, decarboxylating n=2 Tax=Deinococcus TaxID=1298 RepID=K9ZXE8_DEIPD|nr:6-phosphogluconate dehydrogenase, decarboxylating [Deinococcus peraridilitoris DSM 19664]